MNSSRIIKLLGIVNRDIEEERNNIFNIVLEYGGNDLQVFMFLDAKRDKNERKVTGTFSLMVVQQLSEGLVFLHDHEKIIHRDIKPQNILVNFDSALIAKLSHSRLKIRKTKFNSLDVIRIIVSNFISS